MVQQTVDALTAEGTRLRDESAAVRAGVTETLQQTRVLTEEGSGLRDDLATFRTLIEDARRELAAARRDMRQASKVAQQLVDVADSIPGIDAGGP